MLHTKWSTSILDVYKPRGLHAVLRTDKSHVVNTDSVHRAVPHRPRLRRTTTTTTHSSMCTTTASVDGRVCLFRCFFGVNTTHYRSCTVVKNTQTRTHIAVSSSTLIMCAICTMTTMSDAGNAICVMFACQALRRCSTRSRVYRVLRSPLRSVRYQYSVCAFDEHARLFARCSSVSTDWRLCSS